MSVRISRAHEAHSAYEYGCDLRRLYPWEGVADPKFWGAAIASIRPGEATSPHSHDEEETFVIMSGRGVITVSGAQREVATGDVIYLPRGSEHTLANGSHTERLDFITIFWGSPEAREALRAMLATAPAGAPSPEPASVS